MRSVLTTAAIAAAVSTSSAAAQLALTTSYTLPSATLDLRADGTLLGIAADGSVILQDAVNSPAFSTASGSIAPINADGFRPSFLAISPDGLSVAVGNNEFNANNAVSIFSTADLTAPGTAAPTTTITTPNFKAAWADNTTLFVTGANSNDFSTVVNRLDTTAGTSETVIAPAGLFSGGVHAEGATLFVGAGDSGDVRTFDAATLAAPAVGFATGALETTFGSAGDIDTFGDLLLVAGQGGAQITDRATGTTFTLAPAGTGVFYGGFFNPVTNELVVTNTDFSVGVTTAYVYTIPAPATIALAPLALAATRRRRA